MARPSCSSSRAEPSSRWMARTARRSRARPRPRARAQWPHRDRRPRPGTRALRCRSCDCPARRRERLPGHAGIGQHPPPPLPVGDPRARGRRRAVRVADAALPGLESHRRGHHRRCRRGRARVAGTHRLHHHDGSSLRLPDGRRRPAGRRDRGCPGGRPAVPADPRLDGSRPVPGRASRPTTWCRTRHHSRGDRAGGRHATTIPGPTRCSASASLRARRSRSAQTCWSSRQRWPASWGCACTPTWPRPRTRTTTAASGSRVPVDYLASLGWLGDDVWFAHGIHFDDAGIAALARAAPAWRTALPPTRGWAPAVPAAATCATPECRSASASTAPPATRRRSLVEEVRRALLFARAAAVRRR